MPFLPLDNFRRPSALLRFLLTAAIGLSLDLWTKVIAFHKLAEEILTGQNGQVRVLAKTYEFIPGWLNFTAVANQGAVFGIGQGRGTLFVLVSVGAIVFLGYLFAQSERQRFYQFILGMLLAGVLGNMYDRVAFGFVRDMIHALPQWPSFFPYVFNVADSLLCVGVTLMVLHSLAQARSKPQPQSQEPEERRR